VDGALLGPLLPALLGLHPDAHVLVVDDNSPDGTGDVVADRAARDERIHLVRRDGKRGIGSAYRAAFAWAVERGYGLVVAMDADGSHDPREVGRLLGAAGVADVVVGSRYIPGGRIENWPLARLALSWGANQLARLMVGRPVLLRVDYEAGHGWGSTKTQTEQLLADQWSFLFWQLGAPGFQPVH